LAQYGSVPVLGQAAAAASFYPNATRVSSRLPEQGFEGSRKS
jgi:hypothetical protein